MDLRAHRQRLLAWVRGQLIGPAGSGRLRGSPLDRYPTGVLHPIDPDGWGVPGLDPAQLDGTMGAALDPAGASGRQLVSMDDEADDWSSDADGESDGEAARPPARRRYVPPSSVAVSFQVRGDARVCVTASTARYRRVDRRDSSGRFTPHRYERTVFEFGLAWPRGGGGTPDGVERQESRGRYRDGDRLTATFRDSPRALASGRGEEEPWAQIDVRRRPCAGGHLLTVVLANCQRRAGWADARDRAERCLFEARVECAVTAGELAEYPRADSALLTEEEQENELRYRETRIYAIGHGAAADWALEPGRPPRVWSAFMPGVEVPAVSTRVEGVHDDALVMHDIAEARFEGVLDRFEAFVDGYDAWVSRRHGEAAAVAARERAAASRICRRMDAARKRMRSGVARLRRDARAALAFRLANRAMRDQMRQHDRARGRDRDPRAYRWRPFQLAFLLAVVESTIDEGDDCRDVLDLIWFPTGGGKTEAYLGLIAFLSVWRRLQYGDAGGGTAVLMRYTLRLLTRQQFERAARIVCALELLRRRDEPRLGREPFTVGLWVGRAVSPNTCAEALERVGAVTHGAIDDGDTADAAAADARSGGDHLVLQSCPWCRGGFTAPHSFRTEAGTFAFQCGNPECPFGDGTPLPCNVVDEVLYENPPTLLIGTVDKFARLVWEERAGRYLGGSVRRPPELVIQDELHLIAGPLGSVAGLYEAGLETALERRGVRPKYIASTATIHRAREQVRRLYGRDLAVFPPPGLSADDSWFARADPTRPGRLYVGYLAPGLDRQHCLAPLAAVLLAAPSAVFADQQDREDLLDAWWTQVVYHGSLRGVGATHNAFVTDVGGFLRRMETERRQLSRDGLAPGESAGSPVGVALSARGEANRTLAVAQLTSRSTAQENARTFDRLTARRGAPDCLDAVLATNMISVGVDVDRLAVMVVNGQPLTTAEYIQASSRIGRADVPGLVFANYYRHQARSLSHYEHFRPYHESFYRFVEPTSVTPLTYQVRKRALHAALVVAVRHGGETFADNAAAGRFDRGHPEVRAAVEALKERCRRADPDAAAAASAHLDRLVDEWHDEARQCDERRRGLHYDCPDNTADRLLGGFDGARRGRWRTLHSMRKIEDTAVLSESGVGGAVRGPRRPRGARRHG